MFTQMDVKVWKTVVESVVHMRSEWTRKVRVRGRTKVAGTQQIDRCWQHLNFFPTCQVRVVRFYVSCFLLVLLVLLVLVLLLLLPLLVLLLLLLLSSLLLSSPRLLSSSPLVVSSPPAPCRTSTTTIHAQCALPDLNHDHPRPVFPAGPQPRPSTPVCPAGPQPRPSPPSVPCRTSTASIHAQCSLPDLNHDNPRPVFPAGPQLGVDTRG